PLELECRQLDDLHLIAELVRASLHECSCLLGLLVASECVLDATDAVDQAEPRFQHPRGLVHVDTLDHCPRPGPRQRSTLCGHGGSPSSRFFAALRAVNFANISRVENNSSGAPGASISTVPSSHSVAEPSNVALGVKIAARYRARAPRSSCRSSRNRAPSVGVSESALFTEVRREPARYGRRVAPLRFLPLDVPATEQPHRIE